MTRYSVCDEIMTSTVYAHIFSCYYFYDWEFYGVLRNRSRCNAERLFLPERRGFSSSSNRLKREGRAETPLYADSLDEDYLALSLSTYAGVHAESIGFLCICRKALWAPAGSGALLIMAGWRHQIPPWLIQGSADCSSQMEGFRACAHYIDEMKTANSFLLLKTF